MPEPIKRKIEDPLAGLEFGADKIKESVDKELPESKILPEIKEVLANERSEARPESQTESMAEGKVSEKETVVEPQSFSAPSKMNEVVDPDVYRKVEAMLADGLDDVYVKMTPQKQQEFKKVGEETASKISLILQSTKVQVKKIFELITKWLKVIPGVNKFFLEQEAKIKTDHILEINKKK